MTRSRRYLNNLPNAEEIKSHAREILDYELKLDKALLLKEKIKEEISSLENNLITLDIKESPQKIESTRDKLAQLLKVSKSNETKINDLKHRISTLQSSVDEEIREGLSNLYHNAKIAHDKAQKNIIKHQKLADAAHDKLLTGSADELEKYHHEWILNLEKVIKHQEKLEKSEKQLNAIKRVYTLEFG